jgi:GTPase
MTVATNFLNRIASSQHQHYYLFRHSAIGYNSIPTSAELFLLRKKRLFSSIIPTTRSANVSSSNRATRRETELSEDPESGTQQLIPPSPIQQQQQHQNPRKRLDVAIVGAPNAGKSQLLNVLTQSPVAAVSRKRHTTRSDILGARTILDTQLVFKDTPGFMKLENAKEERLDRDLIATAAAELQHVDYTLLVVDAARTLTDPYREALVQLMIGALNSQGRIEEEGDDLGVMDDDDDESTLQSSKSLEGGPKFAIVLNKTDLVQPKSNLLDLAMEIGSMADLCLEDRFQKRNNKSLSFEDKLELSPIVFYTSALKEEGTDDIVEHLTSLATPCGSWAVAPGASTNLTPLEQVQEIIREKIYRTCHREVPHSVQQMNRMFRQIQGRGLLIHQDLIVFTKSHRKLVQGTGGRTLQQIQETAQRDLEKAFGCRVALQLHVKLSRSKNQQDLAEGGYRSMDQVTQTISY